MARADEADLAAHLAALRTYRQKPADFSAAVAYFRAHPAEAEPVLVALMDRVGPEAQAAALALADLGTESGVPALAEALRGGSTKLAWTAGEALARHAHGSAFEALREALGSEREETVQAAMAGLQIRADSRACSDLLPFLEHSSAAHRYHALRAAHGLGCVDQERLAKLAEDADEEVRGLAIELARR